MDIQMDVKFDEARVQIGKIVVPLNVLSNEQLHQLGNKLKDFCRLFGKTILHFCHDNPISRCCT